MRRECHSWPCPGCGVSMVEFSVKQERGPAQLHHISSSPAKSFQRCPYLPASAHLYSPLTLSLFFLLKDKRHCLGSWFLGVSVYHGLDSVAQGDDGGLYTRSHTTAAKTKLEPRLGSAFQTPSSTSLILPAGFPT